MRGLVIFILIVIVATAIFIYSGTYDVAASKPHSGPITWLLSTVSDASIKAHAKNITAPQLGAPAQVKEGFEHYRRECGGCHGAPGRQPSPMAKGLNPEPPKLTETSDLSPQEMFWVIKNGIKMTGMPSWGGSQTDEEIWATVAFVRELPKISAAQWESMNRTAGRPQWEGRGPGGPTGRLP